MALESLELTDSAKEKMRFYLQEKDMKQWGVRIVMAMKGDYTFSLAETGKADPTDAVLDVDGIKVIVDEISARQLEGARVDFIDSELSTGFKVEPKTVISSDTKVSLDLSDPIVKKVNDVIMNEINPGIAAHGGVATLLDVKDNVVYLQLGGGCQGCGMADVTLKQGIEVRLKEVVPDIVAVVDQTDHASGSNPYYQPAK